MTVSSAQATQMAARIATMRNTVVGVRTCSGNSGYGPVLETSTNKTVAVDQTRKLVRDESGEEVVSELTFSVAPADEASFTPHSEVTLGTRTCLVIAVSPKDFRGYVVDVEVNCS